MNFDAFLVLGFEVFRRDEVEFCDERVVVGGEFAQRAVFKSVDFRWCGVVGVEDGCLDFD